MARACLTLLLAAALVADPVPPGFTEAPAYVRLFTPSGAPAGAYRAYVTPHGLDRVLADVRGPEAGSAAAGSFEPQAVVAGDAFGVGGPYNRWKLALLYGARRARVARGPRLENGRVIEAWTLVSPYPDPALERLLPGTLLIVYRTEP